MKIAAQNKTRWQIIPSLICLVFAVATLISSIAFSLIVIKLNIEHGWIPYSPDTPNSNLFVISTASVSSWCLSLLSGIVGLFAVRFWWRKNLPVGYALTVLQLALAGFASWLSEVK
jgi:hypothetical protein